MTRALRQLAVLNVPATNLDIERQHITQMAAQIEEDLSASGRTLESLIRERKLYYRVSIVGNCNLRCRFCHNEGGPLSGTADFEAVRRSFAAAAEVGFVRLQLTGGEPLLSPHVAEYVRVGAQCFDDVGITTNGTYLPDKLEDLIAAGITRIHVSLQSETLLSSPDSTHWTLPIWLANAIRRCAEAQVTVRTNLPVGHSHLEFAKRFLRDIRALPFNINVFAILPNDEAERELLPGDYVQRLERVVRGEAEVRATAGLSEVALRGYQPPSGRRCSSCNARSNCTEQSRSLRFGVDGVLRPCLASRNWDAQLPQEDEGRIGANMRKMALLALDYQPITA